MYATTTRCLLAGLGLALAANSHAATSTGTLNSTLTLTAACQVNGGTGTSGLDFGTLDFGTQDALFASADGQVLGTGGGALIVLCSAGTIPEVRVLAGSNDGASEGGTRALADGSGNFVPYDFYTDTGRTQLLGIGDPITLATSTGVAQTVELYGRALGKPGLPAGVYSDTVAVELSF